MKKMFYNGKELRARWSRCAASRKKVWLSSRSSIS